ncbi:MAG: hypothetical protein WC693_02395 [Patescibacteria group bacterium]|jgi:hypothetical protein
MINKKNAIIAIVIIAVAFAWLFLRFIIGGDEDTWICENGSWVAHGHPNAVKPTELCPGADISNNPSVKLETITPVLRATTIIKEDGAVDYERLDLNSREKVTNSAIITQDDYSALVGMINESGFYDLENEYTDASILNADAYTITVTTKGNIEIVTCSGTCPEAFNTIKNKIEELYDGEIINNGV